MLINRLPVVLEQAEAGGLFGSLGMLLPLVLMFVVMYFLMIRPQKNKEKKLKEQISQMKVGDSVMTIGGIVGRIASMTDDEVTIYTSVANTMMTFKKSAVSQIFTPSIEESSN
ncbi:MAG TPA: preprotein translocase subunit YajC [Clostridiaceae bacterium]|jgi:preprotein translocase subunit YajC|nr:preprotein translocase subunit YajC [Clostridiaceae bacterium]